MTLIGKIKEINRYPIKSFAGESLDRCKVEKYGLYGDRIHAFIDETKDGWDSYFTARSIPKMLVYRAKLENGNCENEMGAVSITSPDGRVLKWNEHLLTEIQTYSKKKMAMMSCNMENSELMAVDASSILIITDSTIRRLEEIWGKELDPRRFRANLVVEIEDIAFHEQNWIGKGLSVGSAELQVDTYCERCSMITIDPDTLERDSSLLKKVNEEMNLKFGVYASVRKTGQIHIGEKVYLLDKDE